MARSLDFGQPAVGWVHQPLSKLKRDTAYTLVQEDGRAVLRSVADRSASLYVALLPPATGMPVSMGWRWKTNALVPNADNRDKKREDAPLRVLVAFDGDKAALPTAKQDNTRARRDNGMLPPPLAQVGADMNESGAEPPEEAAQLSRGGPGTRRENGSLAFRRASPVWRNSI